MSLLYVLDMVVDSISKECPEMSEAEAAFSVLRLNLTALVSTLAELAEAGEGLSYEGLVGICEGLVETCEWQVAKELTWQNASAIENYANEN